MSNWKTVVFALQILQPCHNKISRSPGLKIHIESVHLRKKMKNNSHSNSNSRVDKDMPEASGSGCSKPLGSNTKDPTCWEWFWCWEYTLFLCFFQASTPDLCLNLVCLTQLNRSWASWMLNVVVFWQVFGAASSHSRDLHSSYSCYDVLNPFRFWGANLGYHLHSSPIWKTQ